MSPNKNAGFDLSISFLYAKLPSKTLETIIIIIMIYSFYQVFLIVYK